MELYRTLKNTQRLQVRVNDIRYITTIKDILDQAVERGLLAFDELRNTEKVRPVGITGNWYGKEIQIDLIK